MGPYDLCVQHCLPWGLRQRQFCSNAAQYAFTRAGSISDGTTATGRILGGIFGPNGENAGALLDASNPNTVEFRGDFIARRSP